MAGLGILFFDAYTCHLYGFHLNEVAGVTDDGGPIDWPTGERPIFTLVPIYVYGLGFWVAAEGIYSLRFGIGRRYRTRICRGTE